MFVRFRQTSRRLQVSLVETRRAGGRVQHCHVAGLGSVPLSASPTDRISFWIRLRQRLSRLANRLDDATQAEVLAAVHARIPIPTADEQEAARNAGREANSGLFAALRDKHRGLADVYRREAERESAAAEAINGLEAAHARRPMTRADMRRFLKSIGMTAAELGDWQDVAALCDQLGEDRIIPMLAREGVAAGDRARRRAMRSLRKIVLLRGG
jgi:hypothetical protein